MTPPPRSPAAAVGPLCVAAVLAAWLLLAGRSADAQVYPSTEQPATSSEFVLATDEPEGDVAGEFDAAADDFAIDCDAACSDIWHWTPLPDGLIYRSYLAGHKESRIGSFWAYEKDHGWIWDVALGGRVGVFRHGTRDGLHPEGWQLDVEGAGLPRLDFENDMDVTAVDFRFGVPLTYGRGRYQTKLAYYHLSSHLGDEFLLKNPDFMRLNYVRDVIVWGHSYDVHRDVRVYGEAGWAFNTDGGSEPWEFQFGVEYRPGCATIPRRGAPFAAVGAHLREEVDFGGNLVVQAGWAWRGTGGGHLMRLGFEYFNGKDDQFSFFDESQQKLGVGLWYDF